MLVISINLHPSLIVADKAGAYHGSGIAKGTPLWWARSLVVYQSVIIKELHSDGRILALPANRLGWKRMKVGNTPAYHDTVTITAVKSFIVQTPAILQCVICRN